jgi:hypothetical protein
MAKVTVYRFSMYNIVSDTMDTSNRWATRDVIEKIHGVTWEDTAVEVEDCHLRSDDMPGMAKRGFDPYAFKQRP